MPDSKITALTALTAADPANDMFPIVDVSDTSMAASGTTKRISINNLLAASGTATLASATITGDLTVDTNVLKVDSAGNRVSVNTTTFATDSAFAVKTTAGKFDVRAAGSLSIKLNSDQSMLYNVPTGNSHLFQINDADAMTLNATGLGVGMGPANNLSIGSATYASFGVKIDSITQSSLIFKGTPDAAGYEHGKIVSGRESSPFTYGSFLAFYTEGKNSGTTDTSVERLRIDSSGNVGIGVTPSAWVSTFKAINVSSYAAFGGNSDDKLTLVGNNYYNDGTAKFIGNGYAGAYSIYQGAHRFQISTTNNSSGAGAALTFTQAMTLDASGNLLVGTTGPNTTWSTKLTLSSDSGTTKWAVGPYGSGGTFFMVSAGGSTGVYLNGTAATSWTSASDERLKDIIEPISNAVSKVASLRAVIGKFKFDENNTRKPFLIAQDIQAVLPEAVDSSNPDRLGVSYTDVIPLLVAAIKELTARVQTLETR